MTKIFYCRTLHAVEPSMLFLRLLIQIKHYPLSLSNMHLGQTEWR